MTAYKYCLIAMSALAIPSHLTAQEPRPTASAPVDQRAPTADQVRTLENHVAEIRRDQLNYQIERDLLKEAYSSNLQTVQLVLTMILGAFTVFGYLGLRSIGALRKDFQMELDAFRSAKTEVETSLRSITEAQARADAQMATLAQVNAAQDRRLRGLELREKAASLATAGNYSLALEYVVLGLEIAPYDVAMLHIKANCLSKMGRASEAILVHQRLLELSPSDLTIVLNLLEAYLLTSRNAEYDQLAGQHAGLLASQPPLLRWYFEAIRLVLAQEMVGVVAHMDALPQLPDDNTKKLNWVMDDARVVLAARTDLVGRGLLFTAMKIVEGKETRSKLAAQTQAVREKLPK